MTSFQSQSVLDIADWFNTLSTLPLGPSKPERGKGTDIRIKLERPHDHQSSSVSHSLPALH